MIAHTRRVRHLRLRAPDAASARKLAIRLEDALHTASLPDSGGRVLLVRRLALGRIDRKDAPSTLALRLERELARSGVCCVHGDAPTAGQADAVWFRDALEVHVVFAQRMLSGSTPCEWFWPLALPALPLTCSRAELLRATVLSLAALPEAPVAVPAWIAAVVAFGGVTELEQALDESDAVRLLRACGIMSDERTPLVETRADAAPRAAKNDAQVVAANVDPAIVTPDFIAGERIASIGTQSHVARALARLLQRAPSTSVVTSPQADGGASVDAPERAATDIPEATAAGGLAFLLGEFARLGYAQWLDEQPAWRAHDIARRVLARVLSRLHVTPEDPVWRLVQAQDAGSDMPAFVVPSRWRDSLGFDPSPARTDAVPRRVNADRVVQMWAIALRRWLRLYAHIGLAELVLRPAWISQTPTHLDLRFDPAQVDLRVRRAGLDLDPGWIPWFGRVMTFRYEASENR